MTHFILSSLRPFPAEKRLDASLVPLRRGRTGLALLCAGIALALPPVQAQNAPTTLTLKKANSLTGEMLYWFANTANKNTDAKPLPAPQADGSLKLALPAEYQQDARLEVLNVRQGKVARLAIPAPEVAAAPPRAETTNLLRNGNFTHGTQQWKLAVEPSRAQARMELLRRASLPSGVLGKAVRITVAQPGPEDWHVQLHTLGLTLIEETPYTVSFWAKANTPRSARLFTALNKGDGAHSGLEETLNLTPQWQQFTYRFTTKRLTPSQDITFRVNPAEARGENGQALEFAPGDKLYVAGTFNQWLKKNELKPDKNGKTWSVKVPLIPGLYQYKFVTGRDKWAIDPDPNVSQVKDGSGYTNSERTVQPFSNPNRLTLVLGGAAGTVTLAGFTLTSNGAAPSPPVANRPPVSLTESDFKYAQNVPIPVKYKGQGVVGVVVALRYQDGITEQHLLHVADNSIARFSDVPINEKLTITVSDGKRAEEFSRMITSDAPNVIGEIALPDDWSDVKLLANVASPASPATSTAESSPPSNRLTYILLTLGITLLVAAGVFRLVDGGRVNRPSKQIAAQSKPAESGSSSLPAPVAITGTVPLPPFALEAGALIECNADEGTGPRLVGVMGLYAGSVFPLTDSHVDIGRAEINAVVLVQDDTTSRHHAHIELEDNRYIVIDEGSSNGTYVNGVRINSQMPQTLRPGDEVQIGTTRFRFKI